MDFIHQDFDIIQVDECLFSGQDSLRYAFSQQNQNVEIRHQYLYNKSMGVIGAVSLKNGKSVY